MLPRVTAQAIDVNRLPARPHTSVFSIPSGVEEAHY